MDNCILDRKVPNEVVLNIAIECLSTVPIMGAGHKSDEYVMQNFSWIVADPVFTTHLLMCTWRSNNEDEVRSMVMMLLANRFSHEKAASTISGAKLVLGKLVEATRQRVKEHLGGA